MFFNNLFIRRRQEPTLTAQQGPYGVAILLELNRSGRHIYEGTVDPTEVARRRRKNKTARAARRAARR